MHYLFISAMHTSPWGGSEELWFINAKKKIREGATVSVIYTLWPTVPKKLEELKKLGATIYFLPNYLNKKPNQFLRFDNILNQFFSSNLNYPSLLKKIKPDRIIVSQGGAFTAARDLNLYNALINSKVPINLISQQNINFAFQKQAVMERMRMLHETCEKWFFVSKQNLEYAKLQLASDLDKAIVINNLPAFDDSGFLDFPKDPILTFSSVARLNVRDKGHDIFLAALSTERWKNREWKLDIYGEGPDYFLIQELINYLGLGERVVMKGKVSRIKDTWLSNKVLLMGSRAEGVPLSLIEAFSLGRIAVATDVGGICDWIVDGENGFLVPYPESREFLKGLERLWESKDHLETLARHAYHKFISTDFSSSYLICD